VGEYHQWLPGLSVINFKKVGGEEVQKYMMVTGFSMAGKCMGHKCWLQQACFQQVVKIIKR
jgi:hypothetical protein